MINTIATGPAKIKKMKKSEPHETGNHNDLTLSGAIANIEAILAIANIAAIITTVYIAAIIKHRSDRNDHIHTNLYFRTKKNVLNKLTGNILIRSWLVL